MTSIKDKITRVNQSILLDAVKNNYIDSLTSKVEDNFTHYDQDIDEVVSWKESRLSRIKSVNNARRKFTDLGNDGTVESLLDEKEVINNSNKYPQLICHFYKEEFQRCKILDGHLKILAKDYIDTKFVRIPIEKAPFFMKKLNIKILPTLAGIIDGQISHVFIGFNEFNGDAITTNSLRNALYKYKIITNDCILSEIVSDVEDSDEGSDV